MKKVFYGVVIVLVLLLGCITILRLLSGNEDSWICVNGTWEKHGNPADLMPTTPCDNHSLPTQPNIVHEEKTPKDIVESFFTWYNDTVDIQTYTNRAELSDDYKVKITTQLDTDASINSILCTHEKPISFLIEEVSITDNTATLFVEQTFESSTRILPVLLRKTNTEWQIVDILCSSATPQNEEKPHYNTVSLFFQPMQCEETPWATWYKKNLVLFVKAPTEIELITTFYATQYSIQIENVTKLSSDTMVCQACSTCPTSYYFMVQTDTRNIGKLFTLGWKQIN
ncbi:MAG: hypothetical protein V1652_03945 [bacterium]